MNTRQLILTFGVTLLFTLHGIGQNKISEELINLHKTILAQHIRPDSNFTESRALFVINSTIQQLDPNGYLLLDGEVNELRKMTKEVASIDNNAPYLYYDALLKTLQEAIKRNKSIRNRLETENWSFKEKEAFNVNDSTFAASEQELYLRWRNRLKYEYAFSRFYELDSTEWESALEEEFISDTIFNSLLNEYGCVYDYLSKNETILETGVKDILFNSYTLSYDPHSSYFSVEKKKRFTKSLSVNNYQFGFQLEKNSTGQFELVQLEPGGPAWNSNKLHEGDIVLSLTLNGKKVNFSCREGDEIVQRLSGMNSEKLKIQVKKQNGIIETYTLYSEIVENIENHIHGYVLNGDKKVGYIGLPAFYTNWNNSNTNSTGCANDVGKELMKLQAENIQGLILDLRNNGGGSLFEALALSGAFVSEGSLCIKTERNYKPRLQKDPNRGKLYSGPLIVLINEFSASASEVTAGILQDFNRAVIVGNPSFGKATGQSLIPVKSKYIASQRQFVPTSDNPGYIKLTMLELHNLSGQSHQGSGIQPDVLLPSQYDLVKEKESDYPYSIAVKPIDKKTYYTPEPDLPLEHLKQNSKTRLSADSTYKQIIKKSSALFSSLDENYTVYLDSKNLRMHIEQSQRTDWEDSDYAYNQNLYRTTPTNYDAQIYSMSPTKKELSEETTEWLDTDPEMVECYRIMNDLINSKTETK